MNYFEPQCYEPEDEIMGIGTEENGLGFVTVKKTELLGKLKDNREKHRLAFTEAREKFKLAYRARIQEMLTQSVSGASYEQHVGVPFPESHLKEYDRVIAMLDMSIATEIKITEREFTKYALDEWDWKDRFEGTVASYGGAVPRPR